MGQLDWSGARWLLIGLPVPSQGLSYVTWAKALGLLVSRVEGTAWGWFHRAATTSRPWQWKDYGSMLTCAQQDPLSSSQVNHHPFCSGFFAVYHSLISYDLVLGFAVNIQFFCYIIWLLWKFSHFLFDLVLGFCCLGFLISYYYLIWVFLWKFKMPPFPVNIYISFVIFCSGFLLLN